VVAIVLLLTASGYGYLRYRWSQISTSVCSSCVAAATGAPFNVLIVGSDSRAGNTASSVGGDAAEVAGERSDTIKILHVDPGAGTATLLSIPRDTYVTLSGMPAGTGLAAENKINSAFNNGPNPLITTIEDTFGIPISHFVIVDFDGVINAVNTVGGVDLDFPYPARDDDDGNNNSGLDIASPGCQVLNGSMTLALSRSRYYQYEVNGKWVSDPTSDLGRIERQNAIIEALIQKAKSSDNPLTLNAFLGAIVHDVTVDKNMSFSEMFDLAERYKAFSASSLQPVTLPTVSGTSVTAGDVEIVDEPTAQEVIAQFLGGAPNPASTPPLDANSNPLVVPSVPTSPTVSSSPTKSTPSGSGSATVTPTPPPSFDPTPCTLH
jgi:LCP family protein required for cell wall assembly